MSTKITGLEELNQKLKKLKSATSPSEMKSTMHTIGNMVRNTIEESFEKQSDPWGNKWQSLNQKTIKAKKNKGKILRDSGNLEDKWHISASSSSVEVSNNSSSKGFAYGAVHQWGSKKKKIAARPFLPIEENGALKKELSDDILKVVEKKILQALEG